MAAAQGHFVHVYVDRATQRPVEIPADTRAALATLAWRCFRLAPHGYRIRTLGFRRSVESRPRPPLPARSGAVGEEAPQEALRRQMLRIAEKVIRLSLLERSAPSSNVRTRSPT